MSTFGITKNAITFENFINFIILHMYFIIGPCLSSWGTYKYKLKNSSLYHNFFGTPVIFLFPFFCFFLYFLVQVRYYIGLSSLTWKKLLSFIWRIVTILTTLVSFSVVMHARPIEPIIPLRFALVLLRLFSIPLSPFLLPSRTSHINIFDNEITQLTHL